MGEERREEEKDCQSWMDRLIYRVDSMGDVGSWGVLRGRDGRRRDLLLQPPGPNA